MNQKKYYDGTKLLSLKDIHGKNPDIYISSTNRTAGKTTFFNRWVVNRFLKYGEKFAVEYRFKYELENCHQNFFSDINKLFFPDHEMDSRILGKGNFAELYLDDRVCGYAIPLNAADYIKKCSHIFHDVQRILFDEFQAENGVYCPNEIKKFISIHSSIARGNGEMVRRVPVVMIGNMIDLLNPYYVQMGIYKKLDLNTKYLRGDGYVLEQTYNVNAGNAQRESGFNKAFSTSEYINTMIGKNYLYNDNSFIEKMHGKNKYVCTLIYNGANYGIREYYDSGIIYCSESFDVHCPEKISVLSSDHSEGYICMRITSPAIQYLRRVFDNGYMRFQSRKCKEAILAAVVLA